MDQRLLDRMEDLIRDGQRGAAFDLLRGQAASGGEDAGSLARLAFAFTRISAHREALECHRRIATLLPRQAEALCGLASAETAAGLLAEAEEHFDQALALDPNQFDAYYNRATLRRQTPARNHVGQLLRRLASPGLGNRAKIPLCYALGKELEDLGDFTAAFPYLKQGADLRRAALSYRVEADLDAIDLIIRHFARPIAASPPAPVSAGKPIFVLGLPRTGTTLVERILDGHPDVEGLGELSEFASAMVRLAGPAGSRDALVAQAAALDMAELGSAYRSAVSSYRSGHRRYVDKMPNNFLYLGLIRPSLPEASIVHLRRAPMDALFAIYKTLFRMGYPYSYDFDDLARYYQAYRRLMDHWRETLPGGFLDLDYEALAAQPEPMARRLIEFCGLKWDSGCLAFHADPGMVATASAAQVREPVHTRSVGLWRNYERQLAPLATALERHGIDPWEMAA